MSTLGLVTIGQAPRTDVTPDIMTALPPEMGIVEAGALDQFSPMTEVETAAGPREGQPVYVSRLVDGTSVTVDRESIVELLRAHSHDLESKVMAIGVLCMSHFPSSDISVLVFEPSDLLSTWVPAIFNGETLGAAIPKEEQGVMTLEKWANYDLITVTGPPYADDDEVLAATADVNTDTDLTVMDYMGYTPETKAAIRKLMGMDALLGRSVLTRTAEEVL